MAEITRVAFVSLGCPKNLVDSEKMLGQLAEAGCAVGADESDADVVVVNTCGFLAESRAEADEVILEAISNKKAGRVKRVVVVGCLVQRDKEAILERIPGIDAIVGVNNRDDVVRAVLSCTQTATERNADVFLADYHPFTQLDTARLRLTPQHYAYLRISEGCDQSCTFCTIPAIRGPMHCKPPNAVINEARELVADGTVEISLIGQDTTSYGLGNEPIAGGLSGLLRRIDRIDGLEWIRLMYAYPTVLTDEVINAVAECERVCNYIDLPLQHINNRVLRAMHRRVDRKATEDLLEKIRGRIPNVTLRTTLIAGFPGETDSEFGEMLDFVESFRFDALGVFAFSRELDTPAGRMTNQVPDAVKQERVDALMNAQQAVAFSLADRRVGDRFEVLVDEVVEPGVVTARHRGQAPLVDAVTVVEGCDASPGELLSVRCTGRSDYDLIATPIRIAPEKTDE